MLTKSDFLKYSQEYDKNYSNTFGSVVEAELKKWFEKNKYLNKENFVKLGLWKSKRPKKKYEDNSEDLIEEITRFALASDKEEVKIRSLLILNGVSWPVASVILHFAYPDRYPIMDFRAIWSLGWEQPKSYNFKFWQKYCDEIRRLSSEFELSMRTIDKALWQYSKENQK